MTPSTGSHAHLGDPASRRGIVIAATALAVLLGAGALAYFWIRPAAVPKVSNYVQLTHDGQPKFLVGTEGSRLFLYVPSADNQGMAEMSTSGGEPRKMQLPPLSFNSPQFLSLSKDGSELLVMDGHGVPPSGPLWCVPIVGGSRASRETSPGRTAHGRLTVNSSPTVTVTACSRPMLTGSMQER